MQEYESNPCGPKHPNPNQQVGLQVPSSFALRRQTLAGADRRSQSRGAGSPTLGQPSLFQLERNPRSSLHGRGHVLTASSPEALILPQAFAQIATEDPKINF